MPDQTLNQAPDQIMAERDYFTDPSILLDPYDYFEDFRARGAVCQMESRDIMLVTGFEESLDVLRNHEDFSSVNSVGGAAQTLPFCPMGSDIGAQIEDHRDTMPGGDLLVTLDDGRHLASRSLLMRLFVPSRLKANEAFMADYADRLVRDMVARGGGELVNEIATPFVTMVIADLLGVPEEDREKFRVAIDSAPPPGSLSAEKSTEMSPLEYMGRFFIHYLADRRANPRDDVMSELAAAHYPDGSIPDIMELVRLSTFLFGAGQDTSAKLIANSMRVLAEDEALQQMLRADRSLIPAFIEEMLRLEGSSKITSRLARKDSSIGDTPIPAGKQVLIALSAANRDPRRWPDPTAMKLDRPKAKEHVAFGRGAHVCAGAPLARAEVRVILDRFLEHSSRISLNEAAHGPAGDRRLAYEPSFIVRGLMNLHIDLQPA